MASRQTPEGARADGTGVLEARFRDRIDAGRQLAVEIGSRFGIPSAVAAVSAPGGLVASAVARAFARPLVFAYCAPLLLPWSNDPAAAFGAVDEEGQAVLEYTALAAFRLNTEEIETARGSAMEEIRRFYRATGATPLDRVLPTPRLLLIDDALTPGLRIEAAVAFARRRGVGRILAAAPCATPGAAQWFRADVDAFLALAIDDLPLTEHFLDFRPVGLDDKELMREIFLGFRPVT